MSQDLFNFCLTNAAFLKDVFDHFVSVLKSTVTLQDPTNFLKLLVVLMSLEFTLNSLSLMNKEFLN